MKSLLLFSFALLLSGCQPTPSSQTTAPEPTKEQPEFSKGALKAHIDFLASDLLEGRETGSRGYDIAAHYVASHFAQYGLTAAGGDDSYFQSVPLRQKQRVKDSTSLSFTQGDRTLSLSFPNDFISGVSSISTETSISAELIFAGYGISAPQLNYDDYEQLDVTNKIVVILSGKPSHFPSEEGAHFASRYERTKAAAKNGAIGIIYLQTPNSEKRYSYQRVLKTIHKPSYVWLDNNNQPGDTQHQIKNSALLNIASAKKVIAFAGKDYDQLIEQSRQKNPMEKFSLGMSATLSSQAQHDTLHSPNVVGIVEGTDPELKNEYILYSAHLDHVGIYGHGEDRIHNGAIDNAAGISIMLETARVFAKNPPKRSIVFVAVTAEEKGLLGSNYYAHHPTVAIDKIVSVINLDMPLILYPIGDVIAFGAEHSTLGEYVQRAAEKTGLQMSPDPMPEQNIFVRSDHYSFVKQGVPAIFLMPGFKSLDSERDGEKIFREFLHEHYHQPSDQANLPIDYNSGVRFTLVNYLIGQEIANSKTTPKWKEGDFFGDVFGR
ncbi:M28 family metallopeptidase [Pleionea sp. CnH1-48]|uniref:M28 family metallopeptidase n=1 Tax=Pleionea sp. CnH1-48 TaxID=2954494 RepID=UPI00209748C4|nr:M28 family metallopeptidase [Pleionea sp. CnH1-48]MCO7226209.1 M28 family metallopeptidase [Pleionea sp. CnH1-48]